MTKKFQGKTYLDPKYDPAFKELFDSEDAIKDFLNDILKLEIGDKIKSLTFTFDKAFRFRTPKSKKVVLDVFITTNSGRFLNIEMQKWKHEFFIDRTVLYNAALVIKGKIELDNSETFKALLEAERETRRYELPETISIWICDFELPGIGDEYVDEWSIFSRNSVKNGSIIPIFSKNKYIMISLPNFRKSEKEVHSHLDAWLYLMNHAGTDNKVPDFGNRIIRDALERIRVDKADNKLLARQGNAMKRDEEYQTRLASAVVKANIKLLGALIDAGKITIDDAVKASGYSKEMLGFKQ